MKCKIAYNGKVVPANTIRAYGGQPRQSPFTLIVTSDEGELSDSCHRCFTPTKEPLVPTKQKPGWTRELIWILCITDKCHAPAQNQTTTPQFSSLCPSHYTHCAIPASKTVHTNTKFI